MYISAYHTCIMYTTYIMYIYLSKNTGGAAVSILAMLNNDITVISQETVCVVNWIDCQEAHSDSELI